MYLMKSKQGFLQYNFCMTDIQCKATITHEFAIIIFCFCYKCLSLWHLSHLCLSSWQFQQEFFFVCEGKRSQSDYQIYPEPSTTASSNTHVFFIFISMARYFSGFLGWQRLFLSWILFNFFCLLSSQGKASLGASRTEIIAQ